MKTNKAIFLDRDGTLNEEAGYINHVSRLKFLPGVWDAIRLLKKAGYKIIVLTNQAGLARGYFNEETLEQVHGKLMQTAKRNNAEIDALYFCPHLPGATVEKYNRECDCRKPKPGMLIKAKKEHNIDLKQSYMIGDRFKDVAFGKGQGLSTVFLLTGYGLGEYCNGRKTWAFQPDFVCRDLETAANVILSKQHKTHN